MIIIIIIIDKISQAVSELSRANYIIAVVWQHCG